ncbi:MAG TPA: DoxX family membrane protein [Acetobacteraceae bacterium]|nr:DoxX family membrane protein [Acetobacteraceae bacterium]
MRPNPLNDAGHFLTQPGWFTPMFWLSLLASVAFAILAWRADPAQRTPRGVALWLLRALVGSMWWQQSLWKIPPNFAGLRYWMQQEAAHAAIELQGRLVADVVLPNLGFFGPLVYLTEVAIGLSLLLGLLSRLGAVLGLLMGLNLWLGLYSAPGEWPWTYMFLVIIQAYYVIDPPGRALGADAWLRRPDGRARWSVGLSLVT